jgi:rRNA maturation RNase YbeY
MKIQIHSEQSELKKSPATFKKLSGWICTRLKLNISTLDIIFTSSEKFRQLHAAYLHDDAPGDVLTFNLGEAKKIEAEIYINLDQAKEQARVYRVSWPNEISRLIIHGCLHLAGYSDLQAAERRIMKKKEENLLASARRFYDQDR